LKYITLITHGAMLTPERAQSLWDAGATPSARLSREHDAARGIRRKILALIRHRRRDRQHPVPRLKHNLDQMFPLPTRARLASEHIEILAREKPRHHLQQKCATIDQVDCAYQRLNLNKR
jgi:hypothetical protein